MKFDILSDSDLLLINQLKLPTFSIKINESDQKETVLVKRLTLIIKNGIIAKVFYPVFPPNVNVLTVLEYLKN